MSNGTFDFQQFLRRLQKSWIIEIVLILLLLGGGALVIFKNEAAAIAEILIDTAFNFLQELDKSSKEKGSWKDLFTVKKIGIAVLGVAFIVLLWRRIVWRLRSSRRMTAAVCPKCRHPLSRIRRGQLHKMISVFLPVRRYFCHNCQWKGMRIKSYTSDDGATDMKIKATSNRTAAV